MCPQLEIDECPLLADLDGLRGLQRVDEGVVLKQLSLTDLHGLEGLIELGEPGGETASSPMQYMAQLASLDALAVDWHPDIAFSVGHGGISDLNVLAGVTSSRAPVGQRTHALVDLAGLKALVEVRHSLDLYSSANLVDLGALANLKSVGGLMLEGPRSPTLRCRPSRRSTRYGCWKTRS